MRKQKPGGQYQPPPGYKVSYSRHTKCWTVKRPDGRALTLQPRHTQRDAIQVAYNDARESRERQVG